MAKKKKEKEQNIEVVNQEQNVESMSWSDMTRFKKERFITLDGNVLFIMEEMDRPDFDELIKNIAELNEKKDDQVSIIETINSNSGFLGDMIRKTVKGFDFSSLSDEQIIETLNNMAPSVVTQINGALYELVMQPLCAHFINLKDLSVGVNELIVR